MSSDYDKRFNDAMRQVRMELGEVSSDDDKLFSDALRQVFWPTVLIGTVVFVIIMNWVK